jgi:hypothetical protein
MDAVAKVAFSKPTNAAAGTGLRITLSNPAKTSYAGVYAAKKKKCFFTVDCFLSNVTTSIDTPNVIAATNCSAKTYATPTYWRMSHQTLTLLRKRVFVLHTNSSVALRT